MAPLYTLQGTRQQNLTAEEVAEGELIHILLPALVIFAGGATAEQFGNLSRLRV